MTEAHWHVVHTEPKHENMAAGGIVGKGLGAYLPVIRKAERSRRGVSRISLRPMFPTYLFIPSSSLWTMVRSCAGVRRIMSDAEGRLYVLPESEIKRIRAKEQELLHGPAAEALPYKTGDVVRMVDDLFMGQLVKIEDLDDQERITVLLNVFGRLSPTRVTSRQIERV